MRVGRELIVDSDTDADPSGVRMTLFGELARSFNAVIARTAEHTPHVHIWSRMRDTLQRSARVPVRRAIRKHRS